MQQVSEITGHDNNGNLVPIIKTTEIIEAGGVLFKGFVSYKTADGDHLSPVSENEYIRAIGNGIIFIK